MNRSELVKKINQQNTTTEVTDINLEVRSAINTQTNVDPQVITLGGPKGTITIKDHALLSHLDFESSGHTGFAGIKFGTTEEWNSDITYVADEGVLIVYTDYRTETDEQGNIKYIPGFKIGDGNAYLIDKPFIGDDMREDFKKHIEDMVVHITQDEREFWNNKLNYVEPEDDLLEFTRD